MSTAGDKNRKYPSRRDAKVLHLFEYAWTVEVWE
jgi:hypothetical protein